MALTKTNEFSLAAATEATLGILPGSPVWDLLEPNTLNAFGATVTKTARNPISKIRQRRKGSTTDLDSSVEFETDLTLGVMKRFGPNVVFANFTAVPALQAGASFDSLAAAATGNAYSHSALPAALTAGMLVYARGFSTAANNGLAVVSGSPSTTSTPVTGPTLVDETPAQTTGATLEVAGVRTPAGDLSMTVSGSSGTITTASLDWTDYDLSPGQLIYVGGLTSATRWDDGTHGTARIVSITASVLTVDSIRPTPAATALTTQAGGDTNPVDVLFGRFLRNVQVDDSDYLERSESFEGAFPNLGGTGTDGYEYPNGNWCDTLSVNLPGQDKGVITFGFVGLDTPSATTTRATNAASPVLPVETIAVNTSADLATLYVEDADENGLTTCFKSLTLTMANGVTREKCLGTLGASGLNTGNFLVDLEFVGTFDNVEVTAAIRENKTCRLAFVSKNGDGAIGWDVPSMTLGDGSKELPVGESVRINLAGEAFADPILNTSIGLSFFPVYPTDAT